MTKVWQVVFLICIGFLTACGADTAPEILVLPSTDTPTLAVSATASVTPTIQILPTITLAPTRLITQSSVSNPLLPTFTPAPATQTATFQPTLAGLQIEYFITNAEDGAAAGDDITLFWRVTGADDTRIFRLNEDDRRTQVWDVTGEGRLTVETDPEAEATAARFLIQAEARGSVAEQILTVEFSVCSLDWFFQPAPASCPSAAAQPSLQVEQRFENGFMIWLAAGEEIYVFYTDDDTPTWQVFPDTYTEGMPDRDDSLSPPADRYQPVRGFGLIWRENEGVRDRLGWALEPEVGYDGVIQQTGTDDEPVTYLRIREGGILAFQVDSWEVIPFTPAEVELIGTEPSG